MGTTEALAVALSTVARPGDVVAVESPTYFHILQLIEGLGMLALEVRTNPDTGMDLELPESTTAAPSEMAPTMISVAEDGEVRLDGEEVTVEELQQRVAGLPEADRQKITVRADARVDYGVIVQIIDALRNAGVTGLSLPMDAVQEGQGSGR